VQNAEENRTKLGRARQLARHRTVTISGMNFRNHQNVSPSDQFVSLVVSSSTRRPVQQNQTKQNKGK
jgi:hypothetical protein